MPRRLHLPRPQHYPRATRPSDSSGQAGRVPDRRTVLRYGLGLGAALGYGSVGGLLSGCSSTSETGDAGRAAAVDHQLIASFPQGEPYIAVGVPSRLPFLVTDREGVPLADIAGPVTFQLTKDGTEIGEVEVSPRSEGIPRAYLPLTFTFPEPAVYDVTAEYEGTKLSASVQAFPSDRVGPPVVGDTLPPVATPTATTTLDVNPICTRVPECPFHATSLTDLLGTGRPVVVLVSTPAYCQTAICGPILDMLMAEVQGRPDLAVVHSEVYQNPAAAENLSTAPLAPLPETYQLSFEPVMFITDSGGTLVSRADIVVDRSEMRELLAQV